MTHATGNGLPQIGPFACCGCDSYRATELAWCDSCEEETVSYPWSEADERRRVRDRHEAAAFTKAVPHGALGFAIVDREDVA